MIFEPKINHFVHLKTDDELFARLQNRLALLHEFVTVGTGAVARMATINAYRTARELERRGYDLMATADDGEDVMILSRTADARFVLEMAAQAELTAQTIGEVR